MLESWKKGLLLGGWNLQKAVELAVVVEEMGAERYRSLARRWKASDALRDLFTRLATEEVAHGEGARKLLEDVSSRKEAPGDLDAECLKAIAHGFFFSEDGGFSGRGGALGDLESLAAPDAVLATVLKFENATLHFYRGLKDVLGASPTLDRMIAEEKEHAVEIMRAMGTS